MKVAVVRCEYRSNYLVKLVILVIRAGTVDRKSVV